MAVFDTGPIDNRDAPRTTQLTIRLFNTGRLPALVGVEAYHINPSGDGFGNKTLYVVELVPLNPFNTTDPSYTLDNVYADLDVFGVRVLTSGLGANDIAITVLEKDSAGQIIEKHVLEGELSRIQELLFAYVTNRASGTVTVINTGTNTIVTTIPLPAGSGPFGIAITPDGSRAYVIIGNDTVAVIDTATNTILTTILLPAGSNPRQGIAITPDGSRAYVANLGNDTVTVINTATNTILTTIPLPAGSGPLDIAITPDGSRAYVTNLNDTVTVINTATNTIVTTIPLPAGSDPVGIAITPDGSRAYITNVGNDTVSVIDTATNTIFLTILLPAGSNPEAIAITPDGSRAYVVNFGNDTVTVINTATFGTLTTILLPAGSLSEAIAITPDGSRAYVAIPKNPIDDSIVAVLDTTINAVIAILPAGQNPVGIAITPILLF